MTIVDPRSLEVFLAWNLILILLGACLFFACLATLRFLFQQSSYTNDGEIPPVQAGGARQQGGRQGQWVAKLSCSKCAGQLARDSLDQNATFRFFCFTTRNNFASLICHVINVFLYSRWDVHKQNHMNWWIARFKTVFWPEFHPCFVFLSQGNSSSTCTPRSMASCRWSNQDVMT